ncbi:MAG: hypothetical protein Q9228_001432 [Teloschistes exilis]
MTCSSCRLRWPSYQKVQVEFQGLQAQITMWRQHAWRAGVANQQLQVHYQQSCARATEILSKLDETKQTLEDRDTQNALQSQELQITKASLDHEFKLLAESEDSLRQQRGVTLTLVRVLNDLVEPEELSEQYDLSLADDFKLGSFIRNTHGLEQHNLSLKESLTDLEGRLKDQENNIEQLQQDKKDVLQDLRKKESEVGALRQELSQYLSEEEVEFGTAVLGKRKRARP